jgi:Bifunctional DNA primase/polymerase, N-terminal
VTEHHCTAVTADDPALPVLGLGAVALRYQALGYAVLGLRRGTKIPHPAYGDSGGVHWATTDTTMVPWLWGRDKAAGIAVATGPASGLLVIDCDVKHGTDGAASWVSVWGDILRGYPLVSTPSGGWHSWLRLPPGMDVPNRPGILPGVDIKGTSGYALVPPTRVQVEGVLRSDGQAGSALLPYRWAEGCACQVPWAPPHLVEWIRSAPSRGGGGSAGSYGDAVEADAMITNGLPPGLRNVSLHRLACSLFRRYGTTPDGQQAVRAAVGQALSHTDLSGFTPAEAARAVRNALEFIEDEQRKDREQWQQWMNRR